MPDRLSGDPFGDAVLNLIIAERDTTAQACLWSMFHLQCSIPRLWTGLGSRSMRWERSTTTQPLGRVAAHGDDQIPDDGPSIKKEAIRHRDVSRLQWATGRSTELRGHDLRDFKPFRWIDERGERERKNPWK
ncbi:BQ2448_1893 [Microbotryum intermedium]|uniref:BQ2448_1893 protein n=1 Tax=Microbotryum intermedium TaxID=269621 RepID=A0A238FCK9_9BASI|nr:BQ2448_1893 [Microbotryum intermedium]